MYLNRLKTRTVIIVSRLVKDSGHNDHACVTYQVNITKYHDHFLNTFREILDRNLPSRNISNHHQIILPTFKASTYIINKDISKKV